MNKPEKRIFVDAEGKKALAEEMNCTLQFVRMALLYRKRTNGLKGKMIRYKALHKYGGVKIGE